jgi:hypothetical protein
MRITPFHALPTTTVFNAVIGNTTVSTITLVADGELGLPMESLYDAQIAMRRNEGLRLAEVSCLAERPMNNRQFIQVFGNLSRLMAQYARFHGMDQLLVVVHPKHARFYERFLGFQPIGDLKSCPHVQNKPAIPLCLDFEHVDQNPPDCYASYFAEAIPGHELASPELDPVEQMRLEYLSNACADRTHFTPSYGQSLQHSA